MFYLTKYKTILNSLAYYNGRERARNLGFKLWYYRLYQHLWHIYFMKHLDNLTLASWISALYGSTVLIIIIWYGTIGIFIKNKQNSKIFIDFHQKNQEWRNGFFQQSVERLKNTWENSHTEKWVMDISKVSITEYRKAGWQKLIGNEKIWQWFGPLSRLLSPKSLLVLQVTLIKWHLFFSLPQIRYHRRKSSYFSWQHGSDKIDVPKRH